MAESALQVKLLTETDVASAIDSTSYFLAEYNGYMIRIPASMINAIGKGYLLDVSAYSNGASLSNTTMYNGLLKALDNFRTVMMYYSNTYHTSKTYMYELYNGDYRITISDGTNTYYVYPSSQSDTLYTPVNLTTYIHSS